MSNSAGNGKEEGVSVDEIEDVHLEEKAEKLFEETIENIRSKEMDKNLKKENTSKVLGEKTSKEMEENLMKENASKVLGEKTSQKMDEHLMKEEVTGVVDEVKEELTEELTLHETDGHLKKENASKNNGTDIDKDCSPSSDDEWTKTSTGNPIVVHVTDTSVSLKEAQSGSVPHLDLALSPHRTASDCVGLSVRNVHHLKPHVCKGCSVDASYGCCTDKFGTSEHLQDCQASIDGADIGTDVDQQHFHDDERTSGNDGELNNEKTEDIYKDIYKANEDPYEKYEDFDEKNNQIDENNEDISEKSEEFYEKSDEIDENTEDLCDKSEDLYEKSEDFCEVNEDLLDNSWDTDEDDMEENVNTFIVKRNDLDEFYIENVGPKLHKDPFPGNASSQKDTVNMDEFHDSDVDNEYNATDDLSENDHLLSDMKHIEKRADGFHSTTDSDKDEIESDVDNADRQLSRCYIEDFGTDVDQKHFHEDERKSGNNEELNNENIVDIYKDIYKGNEDPYEKYEDFDEKNNQIDENIEDIAEKNEDFYEKSEDIYEKSAEIDENTQDLCDKSEDLYEDIEEHYEKIEDLNKGNEDSAFYSANTDSNIIEQSEGFSDTFENSHHLQQSDESEYTKVCDIEQEYFNIAVEAHMNQTGNPQVEGSCAAGDEFLDDIKYIDDISGDDDDDVKEINNAIDDSNYHHKKLESDDVLVNGPKYKLETCERVDVEKIIETYEKLSPTKSHVLEDSGTYMDSDLNHLGAVGGTTPDSIQGILVKRDSPLSSPGKKNTVKFNDEVTVETFSADDTVTPFTTVAELAQGDGPSPVASLRMSTRSVDRTEEFALPAVVTPQVHTMVNTYLLPKTKYQSTIQNNESSSEKQTTSLNTEREILNLEKEFMKPDVVSNNFHELVYLSLPEEDSFMNEWINEHGVDDAMEQFNDNEMDEVLAIDDIRLEEKFTTNGKILTPECASTSNSITIPRVTNNKISADYASTSGAITLPEDENIAGAVTLPENGNISGAVTLPEDGNISGAETLPEDGNISGDITLPEDGNISVESGVFLASSTESHLGQQPTDKRISRYKTDVANLVKDLGLSEPDEVEFTLPGFDASLYMISTEEVEDGVDADCGVRDSDLQEIHYEVENIGEMDRSMKENLPQSEYEEHALESLTQSYEEHAPESLTQSYEEHAPESLTQSYEEHAPKSLTQSYEEHAPESLTQSYEEHAPKSLTQSYEEHAPESLTQSYEEHAPKSLTQSYEEHIPESPTLSYEVHVQESLISSYEMFSRTLDYDDFDANVSNDADLGLDSKHDKSEKPDHGNDYSNQYVEGIAMSDRVETNDGLYEEMENAERQKCLQNRMFHWRQRINRKKRLDPVQSNVSPDFCQDIANHVVVEGIDTSNASKDASVDFNKTAGKESIGECSYRFCTDNQTELPNQYEIDEDKSILKNSQEKCTSIEPPVDEECASCSEIGSMDLDSPSTRSEISLESASPSKQWSMCVNLPEEIFGNLVLSISPMLNDTDIENESGLDETSENTGIAEPMENTMLEGSPERGQRLYGSSQNLDRRDGVNVAKRKQAGRSMTPDSRFMLDKEVTESQNRKLQTEIATLQTENKLLKDKFNRSQARISDLETQLTDAQDELNNLQESLNQEVLDLSSRTKQEIDRDRGSLETKILKLTKENEAMKSEVSSLEKKLESSHRATDLARYNSEKSRTLDAHKSEISSLKEELNRVKALLEQSERHLKEEEDRHVSTNKEIIKLTELKNALQQQEDSGGSGIYTEKQLMSLEKRLKITEDRLHQERADRANNLSAVEDKLLTDNAKLQASEKELTRQLNREKDKTRNFEQRVKHLREENEKLRLAMPFDDATLLSEKGKYDIPYSSHSNQRAETIKLISDDMNYILSQIEKQDGLQSREEEEIIRVLWNKRELAYNQLREYDLQFQELQITENNKVDGLKNLRDTYGQAESKLHAMEEQVDDSRAQIATLDATYQQQLSGLVHERHEAFARLKTAEDLLEALRAENEMLHKSLSTNPIVGTSRMPEGLTGKSFDALYAENTNLESKMSQLTRNIQRQEAEIGTLKVQVEARDKALMDVQNELDLAYKRLQGDDTEDRKQEKIDKLSTEVNSLKVELQHISDKLNHSISENDRLQTANTNLKKQAGSQKSKLLKSDQSESKVLQQLRDELAEKDGRLGSVTKQLDDIENQLQKTRQDLYVEQMHSSELESECESLQQTVGQRAQMFEALSGTEREQLAQYQILKETLDNISQELAQKHAQIISLDVNLSGSRDKCTELEDEVRRLRKVKHGADLDLDDDDDEGHGTYTEEEQGTVHQLKIKELEKERSLLKQELEQAYSAIQASEEQYRTLQTESAQLEQELVKEKTVILQLTAEKGEIEQHLEELAEEHDSLIQEKTQAEDDLIKLETKLQEILQKYEAQARKQHGNFEQEYPGLPIEANKVVSELESVKLMLDGKEKEVDMLNDKLVRHNIETEFLHRKVELIHNDSIANREDVARMISELTLKMKEAVSTREVNQFLVGERTKLQNEKSHLEKELESERRNNDQRRKEIQDVIRKVEKTESNQKSSQKDVRNKDITITSLESELTTCKQNISSLEEENAQLLGRVERLTDDVKNLTGINASLEDRFEVEKNALAEEKNCVTKWKEDYTQVSHDLELLQHDHMVLTEKYQCELSTVENLKKDLESYEEENCALKDDLENTKSDRDTHKGQLLITKDTVQKLTQDKGNVYQDYEAMCRSLTEKERQLTDLREKMDDKIEHMKREHAQERARLEQDKTMAVKECETAKREADSVNEQLRQKEIQLHSFGKTLQDLETLKRAKQQLENQVHVLESSTGDSRLILEGQRKELMALNEALAKQQEKASRLEAENTTLRADFKAQKDAANRESRELNLMITELKSQQENERHYLNDNISQTTTRLRTLEGSLASAVSDRDSLQAKARLQEQTMEDLESKLSDESTGRRLAEQSVGSLRLQLEDMRNDKNVAEARFVEMKDQLTKAEEKLEKTVENTQQLTSQLHEVNAVFHTSRSNVKAKSEQVEALEKEISNLKQTMEAQKQNLTGKMKKASLEAKQKIEHTEEERDKLAIQVQQLSADVDSCREHIAAKNKENLKLQEDILILEDSVREAKLKQKTAEDTLRLETDKQTELTARFAAQDEELKRLRTFLAKKMEDSSDTDKTMWQEMNRVIQELGHQMQNHLDSRRDDGKDKNPDSVATRLRKHVAELQGDLNTEKSLHQITKSSLHALEEDCQRLRKQLQSLRRREPHSGEKRHKNRMEAINAIIARSQSQAQALLASGGYFDDTMTSPRYRSQHASPRVAIRHPHRNNDSPDNSYSEDLSIASLPPMHMSSKKS